MIVEKNKVVTLHYRLQKDGESGKLIEETYGHKPLKFIFGVERMINRFEEELEGLQAGEFFSFSVKKNNAYGDYNPKAVATLPMSAFMIDGKVPRKMLKIGHRIPMQDENGNRLEGTVKEVKEDSVVLDFNHPLAGQDLFFSGKVQEVREATDAELNRVQANGQTA